MGIWFVPDTSLVSESPQVDTLALKSLEKEVQSKSFPKKEKKRFVAKQTPVFLAEFDPNKADSIELSRLGLSDYVVSNILKYRRKGGRFSTVESFSRIYGLQPEQFEVLKPYIRISEPKKIAPKRVDSIAPRKGVEKKVFKYPEGTLVDVNLADTTEYSVVSARFTSTNVPSGYLNTFFSTPLRGAIESTRLGAIFLGSEIRI